MGQTLDMGQTDAGSSSSTNARKLVRATAGSGLNSFSTLSTSRKGGGAAQPIRAA
jgi:hypothetical protein